MSVDADISEVATELYTDLSRKGWGFQWSSTYHGTEAHVLAVNPEGNSVAVLDLVRSLNDFNTTHEDRLSCAGEEELADGLIRQYLAPSIGGSVVSQAVLPQTYGGEA